MSIGTWEPTAPTPTLDADAVARLVTLALAAGEAPGSLNLDAATAAQCAPWAKDAGPDSPVDWASAAVALPDASLVALIRLFAQGEMTFPEWKSGDSSPVIALARELRSRGSYPADLTAWLRSHSDNRFLPYGSLMGRR
ncbi:MAG: hypothetical protein ACO3Z6_15730 [Pseudomonadales bacterium]